MGSSCPGHQPRQAGDEGSKSWLPLSKSSAVRTGSATR